MALIKTLFYLTFLSFISFNKIFSTANIQNQDDCNDEQKYSSLKMACVSRGQLNPNPLPDCVFTRDDGVYCIVDDPSCPDLNKAQQNYFGIFLNDVICVKERGVINKNKAQNRDDIDNCKNENMLFCQQLLNLCTIELSKSNTETQTNCNKVNNINDLNNRMILDQSLLEDRTSHTVRYSLVNDTQDITNNRMNFWVAKYHFNGTLLLFDNLENEFLQCSNSLEEKTDYKTFGNNLNSTCQIDINKYLDESQNFFYEIFLENYLAVNENSQPERLMNEIPIKIIYSEEESGKDNNNPIVKRMFLHHYDQNGHYYYYAKRVKLIVETLTDNKEYIKLPHFEVLYDSIENINDESKEKITKYTFISEYKTDISKFVSICFILFIIITVIAGLLVIYRVFVWFKLNPSEIVENNYLFLLLFEFVYKSCKYLGMFYFVFTFLISFHWYAAYKIQFRLYSLMPPINDECYTKFWTVFYIGFGCYIAYMLIRIYKQISFDIFFIDWEAEKNMAINDIKSSLDKSVKYRKYRSAWRMIHVVNQFNALQKKRIFHLYFAFSWIILLYNRCQWDRREHQVPRDAEVDKSPINPVLRNFIAGIIVFASTSVELALVRLLQIWLPLKKQEFMDLCSVSNISVFILDELLHGFYIHGQSPIGKADVNYDELFTFLNHEGAGTMRSRGLENDNNDDHCKNQSYEMYISNVMRTVYDGLYIIQTESMLAKGVAAKKYFKKSKLGMRLFRNFLNYEKDQTLLDNYMNNQLKSKIDIVTSNVFQYIKDKSMLQNILGYTINNDALVRINAPDILFYRDYGQNFDKILFCGMEIEWLGMDLYIFQFFMKILDDDYLALFVTFIIDFLLYYIRVYFGNKNVAKKAVIDERFLN
jgi:meckelin